MWLLVWQKKKVGKILNSDAIIADANCTKTCLQLSVVLLISSVGYEMFRIGSIDSIGSILIAWFAFREGKESFEKAKNDLKNYWPAIEKAIQLRKSWQQPKATTKFTLRVLSKTRNPNHMKILGYTKRRTISKFPILKTPNNQVLNPGQIKQNRKQTQKNG